uniref:CSON000987 protein n=1 Tax=Culicoides sonorensis TaxID=179676 RepID=A0A336K8G6_CULSO
MNPVKKYLESSEILKILEASEPDKKVNVINWTLVEKEKNLLGFLGCYFSLKIEAQIDDIDVVKYFFVKTAPCAESQAKFMEKNGIFRKEAKIYIEILSSMSSIVNGCKWTPKCYFARNDILVMDDLSQENYHVMPLLQNFTKAHVQAVLKSLAILHANSFYLEKCVHKKPLDQIYDDCLFEVSVAKFNKWFLVGLEAVKTIAIQRTKYSKHPEMVQLIKDNFNEQIVDKVFESCNNFPSKYAKVLCHRDTWRNNIMFKFNPHTDGEIDFSVPSGAALLDYQLMRYAPPATDVIMTIYLLQRIKEREMDYQENIQYYYDCLTEMLKNLGLNVSECLPYEEFVETCEYFKLCMLIIKTVSMEMTHLPDEELAKLYADKDGYEYFCVGDRGDTCVHFIDTDEFFRDWMVEGVEELLEKSIFSSKLFRFFHHYLWENDDSDYYLQEGYKALCFLVLI